MKELKVAIKAAKESGKLVKKYFRKKFKVYEKPDKTPVTDIDKLAEKRIVSIIKKNFPEHDILAEEFSYNKTNSKYKWIIDPIDGTKLFIRQMPYFGSSIGLEKDGTVILGAINMPMMNMLAYASKDKGAFLNGENIKVSEITRIQDSYLIIGDIHKMFNLGYGKRYLDLMMRCSGYRGYADLLGALFVAQGCADIMIIESHSPWDVAAAKIIIEEAGGKMTDFEGKNTIYSGNSIATNGKLHNKVLEILNKK